MIFALLCVTGCAGAYKNAVNLDPAEPIRIAVLPFAFLDEKGEIVDLNHNLLIDNVPVVSSKFEDAPPSFVRKLVFSSLEKSGFDLIPPGVVDNAFHHHGFSEKNMLDIPRIFKVSPQQLGDLLACDAVLFGSITEWSRSYYGVQSVATIGVSLKLISTKTGKELFTSEAKDSDSRGLTKGPTGWASLVLEPVKGLDSEIIAELARNIVDEMLKPIYVKNRPEFLQSVPPSIFASSHNSSSGKVNPGRHLTVVALGTSKKSGYFSIGETIQNIPMTEKDEGHYIGEYFPLPTDQVENAWVKVTLVDSYGRSSEQEIGMGPITIVPMQNEK